jgi:DNA-binding NarL/FixJ family response regulator
MYLRSKGLAYKHIADRLDISLSTTKHHLSSVFRKLEVFSSLEAVHVLAN